MISVTGTVQGSGSQGSAFREVTLALPCGSGSKKQKIAKMTETEYRHGIDQLELA